MIPLTLKMRNFLSYRGDTPDFDFRQLHIACISGENGAGKSSFLEAIHWALWGEARVADTRELISRGEASMMVELVFEVNAIVYRVTRTYSSERRGISKLDLAQATDQSMSTWNNLNGSSMTETQQKITRDIVGMSYEIFQNSAYLRQGKADAFVQLSSTQRRELIAEILEITRYDAYQQEAKRRRDEFNAVIETLKGKIAEDERISAEIPDHKANLQIHEDNLTHAKSFKVYADAVEARQRIQHHVRELDTQLNERNGRLAEQERELQTYTDKLQQRAHIESQHAAFLEQRALVQRLEQRKQLVEPLMAQRRDAHEQLRVARTKAELEIAQLDATITTLRHVEKQRDELQITLNALTASITDSGDVTAQLTSKLAEHQALRQQLQTLQLAQQVHAREQEDATRLRQRIATLTVELEQYATTVAQLNAIATAEARIAEIDGRINDAVALAKSLDNDLASIQLQAEKLKQRRNDIKAGEPCPTCQTVMDEAHLNHAYTTFDQQLEDYRTAYRDAQNQQKQVRQHHATAEEEKRELQSSIGQLRALQQRLARLEAQKQQLDEAEAQLAQLQTRQSTYEADQVDMRIAAVQDEISTCETTIHTLRTQQSEHQNAHTRIADLTKQRAGLDAQLHQRERAIATRNDVQKRLDAHQVGAEFIARITELDEQIAHIDFDEATLIEAVSVLTAFGDIQTQYSLLVSMESTQSIIQSNVDDIKRDIERITEDKKRQLQEQERVQRQIETLAPQIGVNERTLPVEQMQKQADHQINTYNNMVGRLRERLEQAEKALLRLEDNRLKLQAEEQQRKRFDVLQNAFSNRGIQAMLIGEYALPSLEYEVNRLLGRMTDNQLYLSFKTSHSTKAGKVQEVLEIEVSDTIGTRPLEAFSGGEAFRISFALRIALSKLLTHRVGRRLETLIIDEGFGTQDAQGRERLVEAINSISDEFRTILVITHVNEVRDMFPTQILIRRTNSTSQWEVIA